LFKDWIAANVKYPEIAEENGISGRVVIQFTVNPLGNICNVIIVKGVDPSLDQEAIRVISASPKWIPGKIKGHPVRVQFNFPVYFVLK
jgi:protein TonB